MINSISESCIDIINKIKKFLSIEVELEKVKKRSQTINTKYRIIYETSPDLYCTINDEGIILECNTAYVNNLGYEKNEVIGKSIYEHVPAGHFQEMIDVNSILKKEHITNNKEVWLKRKDGTSFPALLSSSTIYDEQGNPQYSTVIKDITESFEARKKIEEREKLNRIQLEELKKAEVLKDEFIAMITHELKTPLFPILGYCEMLTEHVVTSNLTSEQLEIIKEIQKNSKKMNQLIGDLLEAQKIEVGRLTFKKDYFDLEEFLLDLDSTFKDLVSKTSIEFSTVKNINAMIFSDRERLTQVFRNIIENATDFVPQIGGRIEIGANMVHDNMVFYVQDNGIGIPKNKQEHLFRKFYQVDTSIRRKHGGNGLGLVICKGIIEGLGGKIWVESDRGRGSTFYFSIPKKEERVELVFSK